MSSMIELVKNISKISNHEKVAMTKQEYDDLMKELHEVDEFLKKKYLSHHSIPRIYSLYGVEIQLV